MAFDEQLANRVRKQLERQTGLVEKPAYLTKRVRRGVAYAASLPKK